MPDTLEEMEPLFAAVMHGCLAEFPTKVWEEVYWARTTLKWAHENNADPLTFALDKLTIGKALMLQALTSHSPLRGERGRSFDEAEDYLNKAVDGLRESGYQYFLPLGILTRATLFRHQEDFLKSWADLDEAREIAEYGQMRLHLTDYHLEACRNIKAQLAVAGDTLSEFEIIGNGETLSVTKKEMQARFQEHFKEADRLVKETGYHRRDGELKKLKVPTRLPISSGRKFEVS